MILGWSIFLFSNFTLFTSSKLRWLYIFGVSEIRNTFNTGLNHWDNDHSELAHRGISEVITTTRRIMKVLFWEDFIRFSYFPCLKLTTKLWFFNTVWIYLSFFLSLYWMERCVNYVTPFIPKFKYASRSYRKRYIWRRILNWSDDLQMNFNRSHVFHY